MSPLTAWTLNSPSFAMMPRSGQFMLPPSMASFIGNREAT
jgi:hypothetical protein